ALWEVRTGRLLRELRGTAQSDTIAFSPDGKTLATNGVDSKAIPCPDKVMLWDVASGKQICHTRTAPKLVNALVFSADGKTVFAGSGGGGAITSYDAAIGKQVEPALGSATMVRAPTLSPDARTLAYVKDFHIQLRDLSAGRDLFSLPPAGDDLAAWGPFQFSPDGRRLAADSTPGDFCLWDVQTQ